MRDYAVALNKKGLKATFQRMHILESIDSCGHMSIDSIYDEVAKIHPSLSLATVYKNIILMVDNGVLAEVPIEGQKSKYELAKEEHIHLVCTSCGGVEDKPCSDNTNSLFVSITKDENFVLRKQQINLYGICATCHQAAS